MLVVQSVAKHVSDSVRHDQSRRVAPRGRLPGGGALDLVLRDASRAEIETVLFQISRIAGERDTVLIYYGGHGIYEQMTDTAFWVPADAVAGVPPTYVSASAITEALLRLQAGNVLVISDSCYSGALMRAAPPVESGVAADRLIALQRLADRRSRVLITSGVGSQPMYAPL